MFKKLKNISITQRVLFLFLLVSIFSFSKEFWEKKNFTVNVTESLTINGSTKSKGYIMTYGGGALKLQITFPNVNKGEVYTFRPGSKTIYYPSLKQTVTQKLHKDEANILGVFNKLSSLSSKKTQTKNGDTFTFSNSKLISKRSKGYTVNFSNYSTSNGYSYPKTITVRDGSSQVTYSLSNFR